MEIFTDKLHEPTSNPFYALTTIEPNNFVQLSYLCRRVIENLNNVICKNCHSLDKIKDENLNLEIINRSDLPKGIGLSG